MAVTAVVLSIIICCVCHYYCRKRSGVKPTLNFPEPIDDFASIPEDGWTFESPPTTSSITDKTEFFPLNLTICEPIGAAPRIIPAPPIYYPQESMTEDPFFSLKKFSLHRSPELESDSLERK